MYTLSLLRWCFCCWSFADFDTFNHINVGHLIIEFNGRDSVSFVAIEGYHDLRNKSEAICKKQSDSFSDVCPSNTCTYEGSACVLGES